MFVLLQLSFPVHSPKHHSTPVVQVLILIMMHKKGNEGRGEKKEREEDGNGMEVECKTYPYM